MGNPLERGISGGQARRLSVGVGVADLESVRLLLLDEPTTVREDGCGLGYCDWPAPTSLVDWSVSWYVRWFVDRLVRSLVGSLVR